MGKHVRNGITYGGVVDKNFVSLTQAEYDALPASKLTDGKFYMINDSDGYEQVIDDTKSSGSLTWSSSKIKSEIDPIKTSLNYYKASNYANAYANAKSEICIIGYTKNGNDTVSTTLLIPKVAITSNMQYFYDGAYLASTFSIGIQAGLSATEIRSLSLYFKGSAVSDATFEYYYK